MSQQVITCPRCGVQNRTDAKFCRGCRAVLADGQGAINPQSGQPLSQEGAQTRHLTDRSNDNLGSSANAAAAAPDSARNKARRPRHGATALLAPADFESLPPGAVFDGRYEALEMIGKPEPGVNVYRVREISGGQEWTMFEAAGAARFARRRNVAKLNLNHPSLVRVKESFEWVPYGNQRRSYLVSEYPQAALSYLPPFNDYQLASWGAQLADALGYLHERRFTPGGIGLSSLVCVNGQVKLTDLGMSSALPPEGSLEWSAAVTRDVCDLVTVLSSFAAQARPGVPFEPALHQVFQRELSTSNRYQTARELQADLERAAETLLRPTTLLFDYGSDKGQKREMNEDSYLALELTQFSRLLGRPVGLYLVADGLGGATSGEIASQLAVNVTARELVSAMGATPLSESVEMDWGSVIKRAAENANVAIHSARLQAGNDMGTTLVGALVVGQRAFVINVGDSRAYLITRDGLRRISHDHSLVQSLVDSGQIREEDVRTHPQRNLILRNLGGREKVEVDLFKELLGPGRWLVLCSDGVWEMMQDSDIQRIVTASQNPKQACVGLVDLANRNGGEDNITVVVVQTQ
jgi:serine/threonine protein phosphatase PrpC